MTQLPVVEGRAGGPALVVSAAPHLASGASTRQIMYEVCLALLPLIGVGVWLYGTATLVLLVVTVAGCLVAEAFANLVRGQAQTSLTDGSSILTGLILGLSLPAALNPYMAFIGGFIAIALGKAVFGGLGQNLFNPAMVGRAFLMVCFPAALVDWSAVPAAMGWAPADVDTVTMATPLYAAAKDLTEQVPPLSALWVGTVKGCVGESSALAALIGGLYIVVRGVADWRQPLAVLVTAALVAQVAHWLNPEFEGALFHLGSGALVFGAFFIATDYVGSPVNPTGRLIFGAGVGALIVIIRLFGAYPEGVMFAILVMNAVTPLIERWTQPTPFGGRAPA